MIVVRADESRPVAVTALDDRTLWTVLDTAPDGILLADDSGQILFVNRQIENLFGYDRDQLLGRQVEDLLPERHRQAHRAHRTRYRAEPRTRAMGIGLRLFGRRVDGSEFPVEISLSPIGDDSGLQVVAVIRDVTERLEAEAEAREIRAVLDGTRDAVLIMDPSSWRFRYVNDGAVQQLGYSRTELLDMTMLHVAPDLNESSLRELLTALDSAERRSLLFTTIHRRSDGRDVPVEVLLQAVLDEEESLRSYVTVARDIRDRTDAEPLGQA